MLETVLITLGAVLLPAAIVYAVIWTGLHLLQWAGRTIANLFKLRDS